MSLLSIWQANKTEIEVKQIQQLVALAGEGVLRDGNVTSQELREFLAAVPTEQLGKYLSECLDSPFSDSGLVLQDIVNELGARLDCSVKPGWYRGKVNDIGFDGIWKFPGDYSLVIEVKTTDAYAINLDRIASYRKDLIKKTEISDSSSILIVVGRKDTGGLEAQVRGSRHAWDIRIISADALLRLVRIKENADDKATINKIRSILTPLELTKLDFVVELLASTAEDIQEQTQIAEEPDEGKRVKKFTPVAFNEQVAEKASRKLGLSLKKGTRTLYVAGDQQSSVRCLASKEHELRDSKFYWYAFHPHYKDALNEYKNSYIAFGCGSPDKVLLFPLPLFVSWLEKMNITQKADRMYWHVQFQESKQGTIKLLFRKGISPLEVSKYIVG
jgi:hypothetical protein